LLTVPSIFFCYGTHLRKLTWPHVVFILEELIIKNKEHLEAAASSQSLVNHHGRVSPAKFPALKIDQPNLSHSPNSTTPQTTSVPI
jgi:hypothetical protein